MENNRIRAKGTYRVIESKDYELIEEWNSIIAKENAKDEMAWYVRKKNIGSFYTLLYYMVVYSKYSHKVSYGTYTYNVSL